MLIWKNLMPNIRFQTKNKVVYFLPSFVTMFMGMPRRVKKNSIQQFNIKIPIVKLIHWTEKSNVWTFAWLNDWKREIVLMQRWPKLWLAIFNHKFHFNGFRICRLKKVKLLMRLPIFLKIEYILYYRR